MVLITVDFSGADDFLPLVTYIMIQANIPFIYSELEFIADFIPETHLLGKNGKWHLQAKTLNDTCQIFTSYEDSLARVI